MLSSKTELEAHPGLPVPLSHEAWCHPNVYAMAMVVAHPLELAGWAGYLSSRQVVRFFRGTANAAPLVLGYINTYLPT